MAVRNFRRGSPAGSSAAEEVAVANFKVSLSLECWRGLKSPSALVTEKSNEKHGRTNDIISSKLTVGRAPRRWTDTRGVPLLR